MAANYAGKSRCDAQVFETLVHQFFRTRLLRESQLATVGSDLSDAAYAVLIK